MQHASAAGKGPTIILPAVLDRAEAAALLPGLREAIAAGPVRLDGAGVQRIGQAGLQLLLSARRSAATELTIVGSAALCRAATLAGLDHLLGLPDAEDAQ